jgi:large subunit ribosomal protein L23
MALFSRTKTDAKASTDKTDKKVENNKVVVSVASKQLPTDRNLSSVLIKPRVTEKAVKKGEQNVYTFVIHQDANKFDVREAIKALYKVTPVKVNIVNKTARQFMSRSKGRTISESGMRKAYVYLKAGDSIEIA